MRAFALLSCCLAGFAFAGSKKPDLKKPSDTPVAADITSKKTLVKTSTSTGEVVPTKDTVAEEKADKK